MAVVVAVLKESAPGEQRVALVPDVVERLLRDGVEVIVETGAGAQAFLPDAAYVAAGAKVVSRKDLLARANVLLAVSRPDAATLKKIAKGQTLLGLLDARSDSPELLDVVKRGVNVLSLDRLPRQLSRAQTMDALSSQSSIAGYRAAIVGAEAFQRYFPMMITAAGTAKPAAVLVLGAGVAGLQAISTARRLGATVTGYDVRPAAREEVTSLGAAFLSTAIESAVGEGGYARELTKDEQAAQRAELAEATQKFDIVITTAQVPGSVPPVLVTKETVAAMRPGSVLVDLASCSRGGNVAGSVPDQRVVTPGGVTIIGAGNLPSQAAAGASAAYARNTAAVLAVIIKDGAVTLDFTDEIVSALALGANAATPGVTA